MWLTQKITGKQEKLRLRSGPVSLSGEGLLFAQGAGEARDLPLFSPYGYRALPPEGEQALLLPMGEGYVCAGIRSNTQGLLPGEVLLSACGATIHLRQDGSVQINGLVITKNGEMIPPGA